MAAKNKKRPRPGKNSDGQDKKPTPTMSVDHSIAPGQPGEPPAPPGAPAPGQANPMTHPQAPALQASPPAAPQQQIQTRIQYKDLPPQSQTALAEQQGLNPNAPVEQAQQATSASLAGGPSSNVVPNMLSGPFVPPDVASFPDDMAHLTTLMGQGYAPGASGQEHELAQNAHSLAKAKVIEAMKRSQQGAGSPISPPLAPEPQAPPMTPEAQAPTGPPSIIPPGAGPALESGLGGPPEAPGAPGGIPPEMIAALTEAARKKKRTG